MVAPQRDGPEVEVGGASLSPGPGLALGWHGVNHFLEQYCHHPGYSAALGEALSGEGGRRRWWCHFLCSSKDAPGFHPVLV